MKICEREGFRAKAIEVIEEVGGYQLIEAFTQHTHLESKAKQLLEYRHM